METESVDHIMCSRVFLVIHISISLIDFFNNFVQHFTSVFLGAPLFVTISGCEAHSFLFSGLILTIEQELIILVDQSNYALVCRNVSR